MKTGYLREGLVKLSWLRSSLMWNPPLILAVIAFALSAMQVDPGGALPDWPAGPGLTVDEGFNVEEGVRLVEGLKAWASGEITWQEVFGQQEDLGPNAPLGYHLPDHPPLGRIWLGAWHQGISAIHPPESGPAIVMAYARIGSAATFGLLILLIGMTCARWYGWGVGSVAALSCLLMPRLFGHAHLASLETVMNLTYVAAVLAVARWWNYPDDRDAHAAPKWKRSAFAGFVWGLALLTKIQAVLIGPPVVLWALWYWRGTAIRPLLIWGVVGLGVFFIGWPWLWLDPGEHFLEYFRRTTERTTLYVWYLGERFADVQTPWHYPFVMFLTTVPVGLLAWGVFGVGGRDEKKRWHLGDGRFQLILAAAVFPLLLFAIPGIAVYDGARLFLVSFPLWSIAIGRGFAFTWNWFEDRIGQKITAVAFGAILISQGYGLWMMNPVYLSYYNKLIGGVSGADGRGMELNYWGDSVTRNLWDEVLKTVPAGETVYVTPVLHPLQLTFLQSQLPGLSERNISLKPCEPERPEEAKYLVVFYRKADLAPSIQEMISDATPHTEVSRDGIRLGAFFNRYNPTDPTE